MNHTEESAQDLGLVFHHVGHVVRDRNAARESYARLGFNAVSEATFDPLQRATVEFISAGGILVELIEPDGSDSPVARFAASGGGLAHLCYRTADLDATTALLRRRGFLPTAAAAPAAAFFHSRIAFFINASGQVLELVEAKDDESLRITNVNARDA
jgi:methylmalonyl-CoA/ethylmalonyl-CoA epimerase